MTRSSESEVVNQLVCYYNILLLSIAMHILGIEAAVDGDVVDAPLFTAEDA